MKPSAVSSQHLQCRGDQPAGDRAPREGARDAILRCLRAAAPGMVTKQYLAAVARVREDMVRVTVCRLRDSGFVINRHIDGYSVPEVSRDVEGSSLPAALSVLKGFSAVLHGQKPNGAAK